MSELPEFDPSDDPDFREARWREWVADEDISEPAYDAALMRLLDQISRSL